MKVFKDSVPEGMVIKADYIDRFTKLLAEVIDYSARELEKWLRESVIDKLTGVNIHDITYQFAPNAADGKYYFVLWRGNDIVVKIPLAKMSNKVPTIKGIVGVDVIGFENTSTSPFRQVPVASVVVENRSMLMFAKICNQVLRYSVEDISKLLNGMVKLIPQQYQQPDCVFKFARDVRYDSEYCFTVFVGDFPMVTAKLGDFTKDKPLHQNDLLQVLPDDIVVAVVETPAVKKEVSYFETNDVDEFREHLVTILIPKVAPKYIALVRGAAATMSLIAEASDPAKEELEYMVGINQKHDQDCPLRPTASHANVYIRVYRTLLGLPPKDTFEAILNIEITTLDFTPLKTGG